MKFATLHMKNKITTPKRIHEVLSSDDLFNSLGLHFNFTIMDTFGNTNKEIGIQSLKTANVFAVKLNSGFIAGN